MAKHFAYGVDAKIKSWEHAVVRGHGSVVEHLLAKQEAGFRLSLPAQI